MIASNALMQNLLFVSLQIMTTRDAYGQLTPDEVMRASIFGILKDMIGVLCLFLMIPLLGFVWGSIVTRFKLFARIEKYIDRITEEKQ